MLGERGGFYVSLVCLWKLDLRGTCNGCAGRDGRANMGCGYGQRVVGSGMLNVKQVNERSYVLRFMRHQKT